MRDLLNKYYKLLNEAYDENGLPYKGMEKEFPPAKTRSNWTQGVNEEKELSGETEMEEFAEKRGEGAEKITDSAKEKGGLSLLTYNHFRVKLPYYKKAADGDLNMEVAKKEYNKLLEKLYTSTKEDMKLSQTAFQELMGKIEVLGELLLESDE